MIGGVIVIIDLCQSVNQAGSRYQPGEMNDYCGKCGFNGGMIEVQYDYEAAAKELGISQCESCNPTAKPAYSGEQSPHNEQTAEAAPMGAASAVCLAEILSGYNS